MPETAVKTEKGDGWALLTLFSPAGLNKLGTGTLRPLLSALESALGGGCRCLALTGEGDSFAVGADLKEIGALTPASARAFSSLGNTIFRLLERSETFVLAGIDGFCLGGGLDLALAADWRLASTRSVFGHPGADLGLITGFGGTQRLPRLIGQRRAAQWIFTAGRYSAQEAYRAGLVQETCPPDRFREVLMESVHRFSSLPEEALRSAKGSFRIQGEGWLQGRAHVPV